MKPVAIIQARMGSSRLPGKILLPLAGRPALWHVIDRLKYCRRLEGIVVATTTEPLDNRVESVCLQWGIPCFRGSEEDVLDRFYQSAVAFDADPIVRITADCPAIDPVIVDEVVEGFSRGTYDIYGLAGEHPDGLDCAAFSFTGLKRAWSEAKLPSEREHVDPYLIKHPELFRQGSYLKFTGMGHHRWTLDEEADYRFLSAIFDRLYRPNHHFLTQDILQLLANEPGLASLNRGLVRNEGYLKSLEKDREHPHKSRS